VNSIAPAAEFAASTRNPQAAAPATRADRYVAAFLRLLADRSLGEVA
jgi:hypothetical protein